MNTIDVEVSEITLTPLSCSILVNEILQGILYQKSQIPFPYSWLKNIVKKKREGTAEQSKRNITAENYFKVVSNAFDSLEEIKEALLKQFRIGDVEEVMFVLGTTPNCPKEIYSIKLSSINRAHLEEVHCGDFMKNQHKILRKVFLSNAWMDFTQALPRTNTFVFIRRKVDEIIDKDFVTAEALKASAKTRRLDINIFNTSESNCCREIRIFKDVETPVKVKQAKQIEEEWLKCNIFFKSFKDCFINKKSACELW